jgi:protein tyrosine/serine phosphatase
MTTSATTALELKSPPFSTENMGTGSVSAPQKSRVLWRWLMNVGGVITLILLSICVWEYFLEDILLAKNFGVVIDGKIYRSGQISMWKIDDILDEYKIETVIDLNGLEQGKWKPHQEAEMAEAKSRQIEHVRYPLRGNGTGLVANYIEAITKIRTCVLENHPVLVHCAAGAQRTGGVIACYRLLIEGCKPEEVREEIDYYEPRAWKSKDMVVYVNKNLPQIAQVLYERKIISHIPEPLPFLAVPE